MLEVLDFLELRFDDLGFREDFVDFFISLRGDDFLFEFFGTIIENIEVIGLVSKHDYNQMLSDKIWVAK